MEKLCLHYGPLIGNLGERAYHDVPVPSVLTDPKVEAHLRELGFGYRAKYLHQTAVVVAHARPARWLEGLSNPETSADDGDAKSAVEMPTGGREGYRHAHEQILGLQGVGPKVADCVCLMGLGWGEAVPVDTHGVFPDLDLDLTGPRTITLTLSKSGKSLNGTTALAGARTRP